MEILNEIQMPAVTALCLSVGYILKNLFPSKALNRFIPLIMGGLGCLFGVWMNMAVSPEILLSSLTSGLASTGLYEGFKGVFKK